MATIFEALSVAFRQYRRGELDEAERLCRQILVAEPDQADALHLLGVIAFQTGKHLSAAEYIERAIALNGTKADFHSNLGATFKELGKLDEAVSCCMRAIALKPDHVEAHSNLGNAFQGQGKLDEAIDSFQRALQLNPHFAAAHHNLGTVFQEQRKLDEAVASYRRALKLKPDYTAAYFNLGNAFKAQGKLEEAVAAYRRALQLKPDYAEACNNIGTVLQDEGKLDEAVNYFQQALVRNPSYAAAHNNLGTALQEQGRLDEAVASYRRALELKPDYVDARANQSLAMLSQGDFERGWLEYEWRWKTGQLLDRKFSQPRWDGAPLEKRAVLLHTEQGFGDTFQFVRFATLIKQQNPAATVIVQCQPPVVKLLARCPGIDRLIADGDHRPEFDVYSPFLSLPGIFRTIVESIPANLPYLFADAALIDCWREVLNGVPRFRVGINWRGRADNSESRKRDVPLELMASLAAVPGVQLISLQRLEGQEDLKAAGGRLPIIDLGEFDTEHGAFMDTAAIMKNVDLVISSDTAVPHLAGALGIPVWIALPFVSDWRWLLKRSDSPWYPTMRLFRQKSAGDWAGVFEEIRVALRELVV
jgi:tetratricopeptide (TPR) repeat protein